MIERYDAYLDGDFSVNYWSDQGIGIAMELLEEFDDGDWQALRSVVRTKPTAWAIRCAETLGNLTDPRSFDVLSALLQSTDHEVKLHALDSVNSLLSLGVDVGEHGASIRSALEAQRASLTSPVGVTLVDSLSRKLA